MLLLELSLPRPELNLALDEALLDEAERMGAGECLRLWEPSAPLVVIGRSSRAAGEVKLDACRRLGIPVLRRSSGGAAIITGPGCLMYCVVLSLSLRPALRAIDEAHRFVLGKLVEALRPLVPEVAMRGTSDLAVGDFKFSGNSLRVKRERLLYHGTLLYNFPLELIETCLAEPSRQPAYRAGRRHTAFVTNLPLPSPVLRQALCAGWSADEVRTQWPVAETEQLAATKYGNPDWNERL